MDTGIRRLRSRLTILSREEAVTIETSASGYVRRKCGGRTEGSAYATRMIRVVADTY